MTDVSVTLRRPCLCPSEGDKHGVSIQSPINFGDTLLQITIEWKTAENWFLARLFTYQSSIVSQILDFIHWKVTIFSFAHGLVKAENYLEHGRHVARLHRHHHRRRARPRAIPLAMITVRKSIHRFLLLSMGMGLRLAAFGRRSSAIKKHSFFGLG